MDVTEERTPRDPVKPPEAAVPNPTLLPEPPVPPQAVATPVAGEADNTVVTPEMLKSAEQKLAVLLGSKLDPTLTQGLMLTLVAAPSKGAIEVKLHLQGPMVASNPDIGLKAVAALKEHPAFAAVFAREAEKPHAQAGASADTIDVHVPNLTKADYVQLLQSIISPAAVSAGSEVKAEAPTPPPEEKKPDMKAEAPAPTEEKKPDDKKPEPEVKLPAAAEALNKAAGQGLNA